MVLNKFIKDRLFPLFIKSLYLIVFLLIINLAHLLWYCLRPEGFWDIVYFLKVILFAFFLIACFIFLTFFLITGIISLFKKFPANFTIKNILKGIGYSIIMPIFLWYNFVSDSYSDLEFYSALANKYKYIKQSQRYTNQKKFVEALENAEQAEKWTEKNHSPWPIFLLSRFYEKTRSAQLLKADEKFSAVINYAYCLSQFDSLRQQSIHQYERALKISNEPLLANRSGYKIFPLSGLINVYQHQGHFAEADYYNIQLFEYIEQADKEDITYFIECQEIVANNSLRAGDTKTAASLWIFNHRLYVEAQLDLENLQYLKLSINAALGYIIKNELQYAGKLLQEVEELAEDRKKKDVYRDFLSVKAKYGDIASQQNTGYEDLLKNSFFGSISSFFEREKSVAEKFKTMADETYKELIEKTEDKFGIGSNDYINTSLLYANFLMNHKEYSKANEIFQGLLSTKGGNEQKLALLEKIQLRAMICQISTGIQPKNLAVLKQLEDKVYEEASEKLVYFTENERESYAEILHQDIQIINSILISTNAPKNVIRIYNNVLASKNLTLYTNQYLRAVLRDSTNSTFKNAYLKLLQEKDTVKSRNYELLVREKKLIRAIRNLPGYKPYNPRSITWKSVRDALQPGTSTVEYITAPDLSSINRDQIYYAIIMNHDSPAPLIVRLCSENRLTKLLNRGGTLKQSTDSIYTYSLTELKSVLIEPVLKATGSNKYLFVSLSGRLNQLSFPALMENHKMGFEILGSTRLVADARTLNLTRKRAVIFGDIDYGKFDKSDSAHPIRKTNENPGFNKLTYTSQEIISVQSLLRGGQFKSYIVSGKQATEEAFINISGQSNSIVHLATHGTFDRFTVSNEEVSGRRLNLFQSEAPMSKCKLVFAGANKLIGLPAHSTKDGIVTAQDICKLDLSQTELVVLSACESGLGDIQSFEGVQGFQRAFSIAGTHYTLVSLWNISDKHTAELMRYFYQNLLTTSHHSNSLFLAQMKMKKLYKNPYYWAGFVMIRS